MHVSIVIPIINEAGMIQACMENLRALEGEFDVLFVDGGDNGRHAGYHRLLLSSHLLCERQSETDE